MLHSCKQNDCLTHWLNSTSICNGKVAGKKRKDLAGKGWSFSGEEDRWTTRDSLPLFTSLSLPPSLSDGETHLKRTETEEQVHEHPLHMIFKILHFFLSLSGSLSVSLSLSLSLWVSLHFIFFHKNKTSLSFCSSSRLDPSSFFSSRSLKCSLKHEISPPLLQLTIFGRTKEWERREMAKKDSFWKRRRERRWIHDSFCTTSVNFSLFLFLCFPLTKRVHDDENRSPSGFPSLLVPGNVLTLSLWKGHTVWYH